VGGSPRDQIGPGLSQGRQLFQQGNEVSGVYVVESGLVRFFYHGPKPTATVEVAGPGTILGLSESMSGERHRVTAEAGDYTSVAFIPRNSL